jgi:hypothetical protein
MLWNLFELFRIGCYKFRPMRTVTTKQALALLAERGITVSYPTIAQWVREGRFSGARRDETERGPVWRIPLEAVQKFEPPRAGRPTANGKKGSKR